MVKYQRKRINFTLVEWMVKNLLMLFSFLYVFGMVVVLFQPKWAFKNTGKTQDTILQVTSIANKTNLTAVICAIVKDIEPYVDEWIDYHIALGFSKFYLYVNEDYLYLEDWAQSKGSQFVELIHFPGEAMQMKAYQQCAENVKTKTNHTWVGFFDSDEFLVFIEWTFANVVEFLQVHCNNGSVSMNWVMFGLSSIGDEYSTVPLLKRCQYRCNHTDQHVKAIARVRDLDYTRTPANPHYVNVKNGTNRYNTAGNILNSNTPYFNRDHPYNVAVFHHYLFRSRKEYISKSIRGRADIASTDAERVEAAKSGKYRNHVFNVYDDTAWQFLKRSVPKYSYYDDKLTYFSPST